MSVTEGVGGVRDPEIHEVNRTRVLNEVVGGLHVAVDDPGAVGDGQGRVVSAGHGSSRSRLKIESADVARSEDRDWAAVERRDAMHPEPLCGGHEQRVGEPRPMLGRPVEELRRPNQVRLGRRDQADRPAGDRLHDGTGRAGTELAPEQRVEVAQG